jgi:hypothetical protein
MAGSMAIAAGGVGVGVSGTGVLAVNMISADVKAFIEGSTVTAGSVSLQADDTSVIMAFGGSASVAAAFGGVGVGVSIGVALGHNMISNNVAAYILESDVTSTSGGIAVEAVERSLINSVSAAASLGVAIGGVGVAVSGAGAQASNVILTRTNAWIEDSAIASAGDVVVQANSQSAAPDLNDLTFTKNAADTLAAKLDDASSTDVDNQETTRRQRKGPGHSGGPGVPGRAVGHSHGQFDRKFRRSGGDAAHRGPAVVGHRPAHRIHLHADPGGRHQVHDFHAVDRVDGDRRFGRPPAERSVSGSRSDFPSPRT